MKELAAFILLIVLVGVGWNQPYRAHFSSVAGKPAVANGAPVAPAPPASAASAARPLPEATPARDSAWMWNKTSMDAPHAPINDDKGGGKRGR